MATANQKRAELARGAQLLEIINGEINSATFKRVGATHFRVYQGYIPLGDFHWRLQDDGIGKLKWQPCKDYRDIAPRKVFSYDYVDEVTDIFRLTVWIGGIIDDLGLI